MTVRANHRDTVKVPALPTRLVLLGHPVAHSLSPVLQNAALTHVGLSLRYETLDVPVVALPLTLRQLAAEGAAGNVTIPHKEAVASYARCTTLAQRVGAVNTFWHDRGILHGDNTDVAGIAASIRALCPHGTHGMRCAVLGAGGSAAAVLVALQQLGYGDIALFARHEARARALAARVAVAVFIAPTVEAAVAGADLVINATPIGMTDNAMPVSIAALAPTAAVLDWVYKRGETQWVGRCRDAGHAAEDGLRVLLEQGAAAFERWFGVTAPRQAMWDAVNGRVVKSQ